ncbi:MAG: hypothetical protein FWF25_00010 [Propionibacteriaceae bacterium]|nr:hypothetical protein [Propionibacteriaceae bacterium]
MKLSHRPTGVTVRFDDENLVGYAGLVPAMRLAEQAGLYDLARDLVHVPGHQGSNQEFKIATLVAGMVVGADSITDMDILRHQGMGKLFCDTRAPSTLGSFLRRFTFGHARQVDALYSRFLVGLDRRCPLFGCRDAASPVMVDLDDTIVEVFGAAKQSARIGYTKVRGLDVLFPDELGEWEPVWVQIYELRSSGAPGGHWRTTGQSCGLTGVGGGTDALPDGLGGCGAVLGEEMKAGGTAV